MTSPNATVDRLALANAIAAMKPEWNIGEDSARAWKDFVRGFQSGELVVTQAVPSKTGMTAFIDAAKRFAKAHVYCDELDARDDDPKVPVLETDEEDHEIADREYNVSKKALVAAYRALKNAAPQAGTTAEPHGRATASQDPVRDTEPAVAAPSLPSADAGKSGPRLDVAQWRAFLEQHREQWDGRRAHQLTFKQLYEMANEADVIIGQLERELAAVRAELHRNQRPY